VRPNRRPAFAEAIDVRSGLLLDPGSRCADSSSQNHRIGIERRLKLGREVNQDGRWRLSGPVGQIPQHSFDVTAGGRGSEVPRGKLEGSPRWRSVPDGGEVLSYARQVAIHVGPPGVVRGDRQMSRAEVPPAVGVRAPPVGVAAGVLRLRLDHRIVEGAAQLAQSGDTTE
jgi:hypothetical protein